MGILAGLWRQLPDFLVFAAVIAVHVQFYRWAQASPRLVRTPALRGWLRLALVVLTVWIGWTLLFSVPQVARSLPASAALSWVRGVGLAWAAASLGAFLMALLWRRIPAFRSGRRGFLRVTGGAIAAAPFAAVGVGVLQRDDFQVIEVGIGVPGLPKDLDGLRMVQLSDIHLSPFLSERDFARAVDMANELRPALTLVTGDLVTSRGDPLDACLRQLARLKADAGVYGCLGNHEIYAQAQERTVSEGARLGLRFLRQEAAPLRFGDAKLNLVGVDYQRMGREYLRRAERLKAPGAVNMLLSHNPDVFETAAEKGFDITLAGHTHGGQVTVEILHQSLNVARFYTRYVYGLYTRGRSSIYVTRGIGTVGLPARIGAPPEVVLIRLCAT